MIASGVAAGAPSPAVPIESRNTSRDPAALNSLKPRSFSDSSSYLLLFVMFVATVTFSNLGIVVTQQLLSARTSQRYHLRDLLDRSPQNYKQSNPRRPRHFSGNSPKNLCYFSGSNSVFLCVKIKCYLRFFFCKLICIYSLELWYQVSGIFIVQDQTHNACLPTDENMDILDPMYRKILGLANR